MKLGMYAASKLGLEFEAEFGHHYEPGFDNGKGHFLFSQYPSPIILSLVFLFFFFLIFIFSSYLLFFPVRVSLREKTTFMLQGSTSNIYLQVNKRDIDDIPISPKAQ